MIHKLTNHSWSLGTFLISSILLSGSVTVGQNTRTEHLHYRASEQTKIVLLGTGTPNPDPKRMGSCVAIVVNDTPYLVDFGPGVVRRAAEANELGVNGLEVRNLKHAFVTHLHSDHTAGYADLILTPWVLERDEPLTVYGPSGIKEMTEHILAAYQQDIDMRLYGLEPANDQGHRVIVHEIRPGIIYRDSNVTVTAFPVVHGSWPEAYGYVFETPDRKIVISGDTRPTDTIVDVCNGCDVLIHEVYSQAGFDRREPVWQRYHRDFHTSTTELAEIAGRAHPNLLILYHQLFWGTTEEDLVKEVRQHYDGEVVSGRDLDVF